MATAATLASLERVSEIASPSHSPSIHVRKRFPREGGNKSMDLRVVGVLLLVPLLDVMLLVILATGLGPVDLGLPLTVAIVVLTALVGMLLVRAEGRHTLGKIQRKLARGELPTDELLDGAFLLIAGALFLTPGIVTDLVALVLVLPPTRYPVRLLTKKYVVTPYAEAKTEGFATGNVYIGGFPRSDAGASNRGRGSNPGSEGEGRGPGPDSGSSGDTTVDLGENEYDVTDDDEDK